MKLSTRLLLPLVGAVTAVMIVFAIWAQHQRETNMVAEARRETDAYSVLGALRGSEEEIAGAYEVAQPLSFVLAEMARTRHRFMLNTLTLLIAVAGGKRWS